MPQPTVSVVIPAFNAGDLISRALDSALGQSYQPIEVVVVDDGSTDGTRRCVESYGDRVRYHRQENAGPAVARNRGVEVTTGEVIAFLDADDLWHPRKLEYQVQAFLRYPEIGYASCLYQFEHVGGGAATFTEARWPEMAGPEACFIERIDDFRRVFGRPELGTAGIVMRRDQFEACGGFDESLVTAEDIDLWLRAAYGRPIAVVRETLWRKAAGHENMLIRYTGRLYPDALAVIDRFSRAHPEFAERYPRAVRRKKATLCKHWATQAYFHENYDGALDRLRMSLSFAPTLDAAYLLLKTLVRSWRTRSRSR